MALWWRMRQVTDASIIEALGITHLSVIVGQTPSSIRNWKARGIPWRWRVKVAEMAKRRKIALPGDFLTREKRCG